MNDNDFFICAFSNASTEIHNKNTLTRFCNDLPIHFNLCSRDNWHVCVQSVGFSANFANLIVPQNKLVPSIRIFSKRTSLTTDDNYSVEYNKNTAKMRRAPYPKATADDIKKVTELKNYFDNNTSKKFNYNFLFFEEDIFFPSEYLSVETINKTLNHVKTKGIKINFSVVENETVSVKFIGDATDDSYWLCFHENTVETFGFPIFDMHMCHINNEKYYMRGFSYSSDSIYGELKRWNYKYPELVKIKCDQVKEQVYNSKLTKDISIISPSFHEKNKFFYHEFSSEQFVPLSNTSLDKITISITDQNDDYLNLLPGPASFVRLKFKKMGFEDFFNVRLCSEGHDANNFKVDLPQPYYLDSKWKVMLTSVNYPNIFRPLPFEQRHRMIYAAKVGFKSESFELTNSMYDMDAVVRNLNSFTSSHINANVKLENISINNVSQMRVKVILKNPDTVFMMSKYIAEMLGYRIGDFASNESVVDKGGFVTFLNTKNKTNTTHQIIPKPPEDTAKYFLFGYNPDINHLKPEYLMLYSDVIEPSIVGSNFSNLLKIMPIFNDSHDANKIQEFKSEEFHPLESTLIKSIKINIRSHSGMLINFPSNSRVYLNLLFMRK